MSKAKSFPTRIEILLAVSAFVVFMAFGAATAGAPGLSWDEATDLKSAANVVLWFKGEIPGGGGMFSLQSLEQGWGNDWKHAPLSRTIHAAAWFVSSSFSNDRWFRNVTAFRLGGVFAFALLGAMVAFAGARTGSVGAGALSAVLLLCIPRAFAHSHLCATDIIEATMFFAAALAGWKASGARNLKWTFIFGVALSAALLAKETGVLLIPLFFVLCALRREKQWWLKPLAAVAVASVMFFVLQPAYWPAPAEAAKRYFGYILHSGGGVSVWTYYFGVRFENGAPWHYPFVMLGITTPVLALALFAAGCAEAIRARAGFLLWCVACCFAVPAFFALPFVPSYDCERLLVPCMGFLAVVAGAGGAKAAARLGSKTAAAAAVLLFIAISAYTLERAHPLEHVYFNELAGGTRGAVVHGMDVDYWGQTIDRNFVAEVGRILPEGARLTAIGYNMDNLDFYQKLGYLRSDISVTSYYSPSDAALIVYRPGVFDRKAWMLFQRSRPVTAIFYKGVLLTGLYRCSTM